MGALDLHDLTLPAPDSLTVRRVFKLCLQQLLGEFQRTATVPAEERALLQQVKTWLGTPHALRIASWPTVSTLLRCVVRHARAGGDVAAAGRWLREAGALVALDLAAHGQLPAPVTLGAGSGARLPVLAAPWLEVAFAPGESVHAWRFENGVVAALAHDGSVVRQVRLDPPSLANACSDDFAGFSVRRAYHAIVPGIWLALHDNNPLSDFEAHPDKHGNSLDLGAKSVDEWLASLRTAFQLIERHLPGVYGEMRSLLRLVAPVGWDAEKHLSASYQEAVGLVYLTLHPQLMTMAEAVVHEFQHNKVNAAFALDPLLVNAFSPLYPSPVRPDPRPLHGVLLAVHAFQPVARLYQRMLEDGHELSHNPAWLQRYATILRMNRAGAATVIGNGQPTSLGRGVIDEMRRLDAEFAASERTRLDEAEAGATAGRFFDAALAEH